MHDSSPHDLAKLQAALAELESQRNVLGEAVEPALELLRNQISILQERGAPASVPEPAEARRIVTILFADIVGSTSLAENLDPEDWRQLLTEIHHMAGSVVESHSGTVLQYLGDGLLALFGGQASSESDPENAVRAALAIQSGLASLKVAHQVQMRLGVHTGLVVLGELGSATKREFTASGDAMNLAARLQSAAPAGGVLISHDTYRSVRGVFEFAPQPPLTVKGKGEHIQTYLVLRARARPFRALALGVSGVQTRTVGRETELEKLQSAYQTAFANRSLVWAQLIGEPGVGKSRLLADMSEWLDLRPEYLRTVQARAYAGDLSQPFSLVRRMWFDRFKIAEDEPLAQAEAKWVNGFQELGRTSQVEPAHTLGLLVGLKFSDSSSVVGLRDNPIQLKERANLVSRELLSAIRRETPLVILIEDLHWADASSLEYLMDLLAMEQKPLEDSHGGFILATARPEWIPPQALLRLSEFDPPGYVQIDLAPLSPAASHELALELLKRVESAPEILLRLIVERSEGVPYYAEELVNLFIDRGAIKANGDRWYFVSENLDSSQLPLTLQHLLLTRLLSLPPLPRTCLQHGSVFGRQFWEAGLEMLGISAPRAQLLPLQPRGFIDRQPESSFEHDTEWSFHHALLRDVAYESLLKRDRPGLHKAAAAWLEAQARQADRLNEFAGVLGEHAERAGDLHLAADWYLQAGEHAKNVGATHQAKNFFDRVLELLPVEDRERRWRALLGRNDALSILGDPELRRSNLASLLELAGQLDETSLAEASYRQGNYLESQGDYHAAIETYDSALAAARRAGNDSLEALVLAIKVIGQNRLGDLEGATETADAALAKIQLLDERTAVRVLNNVAVFYVECGDIARAAQLHRDQANINHHLGDRSSEANALSNLGYDYAMLGLFSQACKELELALQIQQAIGARRESAYTLLNLGLVHWRCRNAASAQPLLQQAQSDLEAVGDTFGYAAGLSYLALVSEQSNDMASAQHRYEQANTTLNSLGVPGYAADATAGLARCALSHGQRDKALHYAQDLWSHLQQHGSQGMEFPIWAHLTCVQVFEALGHLDESRSALQQGYQDLALRAQKISDPEWRDSFLKNVPEHQAILESWDRLDAPPLTRSSV